jgi:hypothetical protein
MSFTQVDSVNHTQILNYSLRPGLVLHVYLDYHFDKYNLNFMI